MRRGRAASPSGPTSPVGGAARGQGRAANGWCWVLVFVAACGGVLTLRVSAATRAAVAPPPVPEVPYEGSAEPKVVAQRDTPPEASPLSADWRRFATPPEEAPPEAFVKSERQIELEKRVSALEESLSRRKRGPSKEEPASAAATAASSAPQGDACTEEMWLLGLRRPCGLDVAPELMAGTCCAFRTELPAVERIADLNVPNATSRRAVAVKPLWGYEHNPAADVVMGLAFGYSVANYKFFVGSLRKAGFRGDVVLSVSPEAKMGRKVADYLRNQKVLAYPFQFTCSQKGMSRRRLLVTPGGCVLDDWYVR